MAFEIDFIGVGDESKKDADAICFRWSDDGEKYSVGIYDGGLSVYGKKLVDHLNQYYFDDPDNLKNKQLKVIDFVVVSHSDMDHTKGILDVLENFNVKSLYMNRPWLYAEDVFDNVSDGRITIESLKKRIQEKYLYIAEIEDVAQKHGVPIYEAFQGISLGEHSEFTILSPDKEFYCKLLVESEKTPLKSVKESAKNFISKIKEIFETWSTECLREDISTSEENEMSVVLYGTLDKNVLFTGDAGKRALSNAIEYANDILNIRLKELVNFYQIPHHGGRHNVTPSILDELVGDIVKEGSVLKKIAYASTAKDSDHPKRMVVNGFIRRGVKVYATNGVTLWHHSGTPARLGWSSAVAEVFSKHVEDWDD